ncbi:histidinol-phosphatase [Thalassospira alkalitolerans]|uniref:histidinol-phosphatase n=1 Tax=Thalassospira alkalitolerans TaxID=1293890 RepID=UPI0030EDBBFA|tara:strand:+ start:27274 stop:28071 length:798 start_codon:yes stop_codon:yes gene_type:complete
MNNMLTSFCDVAHAMLAASRPIARQYFRAPLTVERKPDQSPVTFADRMIETAMKAVLSQHLPDHGILGEEHGGHGLDTRYVWVIDPIDGTKSFISGVPVFGTLIALLDDGRPVLGVIDMPLLAETWVGRAGSGTFCGDDLCTTGKITALDDAILFATSPDQFVGAEADIFENLSRACIERRFGGDCYSYGLLASGHVDLILEASLQPYDFLALVPIVTGAGGVITDWDGNVLDLSSNGQVLAAATPELHAKALERIAQTRNRNVA